MNIADMILLIVTIISGFFVVYHHALYPIILKIFSNRKNIIPLDTENNDYQDITIIIPAYNEEEFIQDKIFNLTTLDYPSDLLHIVLYCDGCTDNTADLAREALKNPICSNLDITIIEKTKNIGKTAALNSIIPSISSDIVALSDVSALLSIDALKIANAHFHNKQVGVVAGTYQILNSLSAGEEAYWTYQTQIKKGESALGGPIGAHGAFYVFRRDLFTPLQQDAINDDFIIPMEIIGKGYKAIYETDIMALELEEANDDMDYTRRCRLAKGNVQQVFQLNKILHPKHGGTAFSFFSGKVLRAVMPLLMLICLFGSLALSFSENLFIQIVFSLGFIGQTTGYALALLKEKKIIKKKSKIIDLLHYLVFGHIAGLVGLYQYTKGKIMDRKKESYVPVTVQIGKRIFDITTATCGFICCIPLVPVLAILIKLDSPGPVIFKQLRIGESSSNKTNLFWLYKFRTMGVDAEKGTGAVWAQKNDPRVTRIGKFLRKTRLDEIPQLINVLKGDMSMIGPRPERPGITGDLNHQIPFFAERTYHVKPGITGLAQVYNGYDQTIEDARNKAAYDHSYAISLSKMMSWLSMDFKIIYQTIMVVVGAKGQ